MKDAAGHPYTAALVEALNVLDTSVILDWGYRLATRLRKGARLLVAGNGGSAAQAQHLAAELVGRFHPDGVHFSVLPLHADTSTVTALANDYGYDDVFARQIYAHGRTGDIVLVLSTSGRSRSIVRAAEAARRLGLASWGLTGRAPNPVATTCDEHLAVTAKSATNVQECHLVAIHLLCNAVEEALCQVE
jgi:D-sedoheptulose 7-phosphate isomerase